jgi:hypothetical protein
MPVAPDPAVRDLDVARILDDYLKDVPRVLTPVLVGQVARRIIRAFLK